MRFNSVELVWILGPAPSYGFDWFIYKAWGTIPKD